MSEFSCCLSVYFHEFLQFFRIEQPPDVEHNQIYGILPDYAVNIFRTDTAEHLRRRLNFVALYCHDTRDPVDDNAYLASVYIQYDKTALKFIVFRLFGLFQMEPFMQIYNGYDLAAQIENAFNVIRRIRNCPDILNLYDFFDIHYVNTI